MLLGLALHRSERKPSLAGKSRLLRASEIPPFDGGQAAGLPMGIAAGG